MKYSRVFHSSWEVEDGIILMGGTNSRNTAEIAKWDGTTEELINFLKYDTWYSSFCTLHYLYLYFNVRFACAIPDPAGPSVVVTGGVNIQNTVSRYNRSGWVEDLANMTEGRYRHGCAGYMKDGELVSRYS